MRWGVPGAQVWDKPEGENDALQHHDQAPGLEVAAEGPIQQIRIVLKGWVTAR